MEVFSPLFSGRNHPKYQAIDLLESMDRAAYPNDLRIFMEKTESVSSGGQSVGEGMDAKLEEKNKAYKAWHKGAPLAADWIRVFRNLDVLQEVSEGPRLPKLREDGRVLRFTIRACAKAQREHDERRPTCTGLFRASAREERTLGLATSEKLVCDRCGYGSSSQKFYDEIKRDGPGERTPVINMAAQVALTVRWLSLRSGRWVRKPGQASDISNTIFVGEVTKRNNVIANHLKIKTCRLCTFYRGHVPEPPPHKCSANTSQQALIRNEEESGEKMARDLLESNIRVADPEKFNSILDSARKNKRRFQQMYAARQEDIKERKKVKMEQRAEKTREQEAKKVQQDEDRTELLRKYDGPADNSDALDDFQEKQVDSNKSKHHLPQAEETQLSQ
ncbi:Hypp6726 [Branchiostoma lanceolatum]|uniref:Hypp6726 protein n=1 Tax=Branchiostoma lanceolatum TaxID=7740 RepID=A0A8J9YVF1_BRALA|nr:Hypp6726 [Branchiostoma lanceolatum]